MKFPHHPPDTLAGPVQGFIKTKALKEKLPTGACLWNRHRGATFAVSNALLLSLLNQRNQTKEELGGSVHKQDMAVVFEQAKGGAGRKWECKQCHQLVAESDTIAYHLVDGILYGWCENCFRERPKVVVKLAA